MEDKDGKDTKQDEKQENTTHNNESEARDNTSQTFPRTSINIFLTICIVGVSLGILLEIVNVQNRRQANPTKCKDNSRKYWVYANNQTKVNDKNGILKHVHLVLERVGYELATNDTQRTLLWSHDYPFRVLYPNLHKLRPGQMVNHFPGTGYITTKMDLSTSGTKYIPKSFKLPQQKGEFLEYASRNKNAMFLKKHNEHRGIYLQNVSEIDLEGGGSFVQEYMQRPFLVDGHKFDIGVYVVVTSVDPLRVYWYKGDVLFRFCLEKYYPFDAKNLNKYIVADDYLPIWQVPSLAQSYTDLGFSMKDSFDLYARSKGLDPSRMWADALAVIADVFVSNEHHIIAALKNYPSPDNFFELMRFDLVVDEELRVSLLEANMSPNLSSAHYPPNRLLYEQLLYSVFGLAGVGAHAGSYTGNAAAAEMVTSQKNLAVWGRECGGACAECGARRVCLLCRPCARGQPRLLTALRRAHREALHRGDFRRLYPPAMKPNEALDEDLNHLSKMNLLQHLWYQGKCNIDPTWCT